MDKSEVTQTGIPTAHGLAVAPQPQLDVSSIDFKVKLGLKSPVDLLVSCFSGLEAVKNKRIGMVRLRVQLWRR